MEQDVLHIWIMGSTWSGLGHLRHQRGAGDDLGKMSDISMIQGDVTGDGQLRIREEE